MKKSGLVSTFQMCFQVGQKPWITQFIVPKPRPSRPMSRKPLKTAAGSSETGSLYQRMIAV